MGNLRYYTWGTHPCNRGLEPPFLAGRSWVCCICFDDTWNVNRCFAENTPCESIFQAQGVMWCAESRKGLHLRWKSLIPCGLVGLRADGRFSVSMPNWIRPVFSLWAAWWACERVAQTCARHETHRETRTEFFSGPSRRVADYWRTVDSPPLEFLPRLPHPHFVCRHLLSLESND